MAPKKLLSATTTTFSHTFCAENPNKLDDVYSVEKKPLGEGSYGQVCKGVHKDTGAVRAIKAINRHKISDPARFQVEVDIQSSLDHPNIVKLYEVFQDAKRFYLVMEICSGGELFERIVAESEKHDGARAFDERGAATYMQQILGAMSYLHKNNFVHRDIKPENFLMQNTDANAEIKVIDFGLAKHFVPGSSSPMKTRAGTPYYVAPQVLSGAYDEKCDIWSCGVICYILMCGYPPFYGEKDKEILAMVKKGEVKFDPADWSDVSSDAIEFIKLMLTYDPRQRPSASTLLMHKWLTASVSAPVGAVAKDLGHKLKRFQSNSRMKKVALTLIAQQLKDDDLKELRDTFIQLDKNRDGTLSLEEIQTGMRTAKADLPDDIVQIVKNLDTDGSGNIDYTEFMAATLTKKQYLRREVMWAAFRVFDTNGDGVITKDELAKILKEEDNMSYIEKMVQDVDLDSNGEISFDEFCKMMEKDSAGILSAAAQSEDRYAVLLPGDLVSLFQSGLSATIGAWKVNTTGWHRAVLNTLIRQNESLTSPVVQTLPMGMFVHVIAKHGRRVRINYPAVGWTSIQSPTGQPILMWDDPEARNKNVWDLPQHERNAVLEAREVLRLNAYKEKQATHDAMMRKGITSLVNRYKSGELQKSLEHAFSADNIRTIQGTIEDSIENVGNATEKVLHSLAENKTSNAKLAEEVRQDTDLIRKQQREWRQAKESKATS
ncbi:CPK2 [Symbiodinium microadriaticum]|nr:CPK2 [Symbiodinium microadriaticum]CAE7909165.1 CPK2 [Symbiodinium sp. KB8]